MYSPPCWASVGSEIAKPISPWVPGHSPFKDLQTYYLKLGIVANPNGNPNRKTNTRETTLYFTLLCSTILYIASKLPHPPQSDAPGANHVLRCAVHVPYCLRMTLVNLKKEVEPLPCAGLLTAAPGDLLCACSPHGPPSLLRLQ